MATPPLKRLRFRLRTLLGAISVLCALLASWKFYTMPSLAIEPVDVEHTRVKGRFFMRDGPGVMPCGMAAFYISPESRLSWPAVVLFNARESWWCLYEFDQTFEMSMSQEGRYDVRLSVPDLADYWFSFGDKTLPSLTDKPNENETWAPFPDELKPESQDFVRGPR